ncbi:unnamed protein product [Cylicostephanus goldi]|uniref:Ig-like domain-containing protein n=1 Tax=Cylicostephanus goldi TaxID=71465 RepID=A0A3P6RD05_CYLGO|nr:unnamed protein product [Cylicostephanus goldi]
MSKSPLEVKWYRNGELLNKDAFGHRFRENKKHMTLDIKAVEVSDQGLWTCKVSNHLGKVDRNFTVEIIGWLLLARLLEHVLLYSDYLFGEKILKRLHAKI